MREISSIFLHIHYAAVPFLGKGNNNSCTVSVYNAWNRLHLFKNSMNPSSSLLLLLQQHVISHIRSIYSMLTWFSHMKIKTFSKYIIAVANVVMCGMSKLLKEA